MSLPDFFHTFFIILPMKALITSQSDQLTLQILPFILTIQLTFLKHFYTLLIFYETQRFLPHLTGTKHTKGPLAENDHRPDRGPGALQKYKTAGRGEQLQLPLLFSCRPGREQPDPLPTVKTSYLIITSQEGPQLLNEDLRGLAQ